MNRILVVVVAAGSLVSVALIALAGCGSSLVDKGTRHAGSGITSVVQTSLEANEQVKTVGGNGGL